MLQFYERLARRLYPLRHLVTVLGVAACGALAAILVFSSGPADEAYMLLGLVVLLWSLCLRALVHAFIHPAPAVSSADSWLTRSHTRVRRGVRWMVAMLMTLLCIAVLLTTVRAVGLISRSI